MTIERIGEQDPRMQSALAELRSLILERYPTATFEVSVGDDPEGVYLTTTVDVEDPDEVVDLVINHVVDLHINEKLPIHVIPIRPLTRVLEEVHRREEARSIRSRPAALGL